MGAVGGPLQASCSDGGAGVHRLQPGQEPLQEKDAKRRSLAAAFFLWPAEITIVIWKTETYINI
jgi:hypothetical protein